MSSRAVVLLSGGQDSTTLLFWAKQQFDEVEALSIFYGQRHATELAAAKEIAELAVVKHTKIDLPVLGALSDSALVDMNQEIQGSGGRPDKEMPQGLPTSFVPGRNILFLTIAAAFAVKLGVHDIVTGICQTDYSGYPDCRRTFVDALEKALVEGMPSSSAPLRILTPLMYMTKAETVRLAWRLSHGLKPPCWLALAKSVTCYHGLRPGCGMCGACELRKAGFAEAGYTDPAHQVGA